MMMAAADHPVASGVLPLLETLEDGGAGEAEQTDAYLTVANRLRGEHGRLFLPVIQKHFPRVAAAALAHISSGNAELSQAALQALGFCVFHHQLASALSESLVSEILAALCSLVVKSSDKNTCTRALWVISKQSFPSHTVGKQVPSILETLENVWTRDAVQSVVMEHEALNVIISLLEQVPVQMGEGAVQWARMVVPLVVHQAPKLRLRAAAALETGIGLLLEKQIAVAAVIEPLMATKLVPELQKLFMSKNETNVLKLWPLFVRLLGKLLHRGGPFINSLLHLEELGFRSSSPSVKKIAFIAWKSLIDNFALNPDILCSAKRLKLLLQPLISISVRTEALLLTKVEVWWHLVVRLGTNLSSSFDQVSVPLLQCTLGSNSSSTSSRGSAPATPKTGFSSPANSSRMSLNSSLNSTLNSSLTSSFPSVRLLALEMLLHYLEGPEVEATASKNLLVLSLEPLTVPLLCGSSSFSKHSTPLICNLRDAYISLGREAPESLLTVIWRNLVRMVNMTIESGGSKKERHGGEVLTQMLQALQDIVTSEALPPQTVLVLLKITVDGIPRRVLGSASYQVGKMDVLNGTPALFLLLLLYNSSLLPTFVQDQGFFPVLRALVSCGLSGPTSPLAFSEALLCAVGGSAASLQDPEMMWKMWSAVVEPLTDTITQSNEVNQGDALEHNFSAVLTALMLPVTHFLRGDPLLQASQKAMLVSWSRLYRAFARCAALVATAEENVCCEELSTRMLASLDRDALKARWTLESVASMLQVMVDSVDFSPYTPHFQHKLKSPHTPVGWTRRRARALGNLSSFRSLLVRCLEVHLEAPACSTDATPPPEATSSTLISVVSALFANLTLADVVQDALTSLVAPLTQLYNDVEDGSPLTPLLQAKLEKLLADILGCLRTRTSIPFDRELLAVLSPLLCVLFPHKNKVMRLASVHFWNATFANAADLTYPDQLRPVLMQVKQRTPIILPGFEAVGVGPDELSEVDSSESSQMETRISGIHVSSSGMRDTQPGPATDPKDQNSTRTSKPVSTKLDFGSPKPPRREVLEEEASIDFVFIPPEAKERVLTEHQKEVKRTKRVDIPAMYNNLDASLDTAVFSQYSQSQEDSLDRLPMEQVDAVAKEAAGEVAQEDVEMVEDSESATKKTENSSSTANEKEVKLIPETADSPVEEAKKNEKGAPQVVSMESKEDTSLDVSASSDLVSGTPQKSNSRRQSFITLEKYKEGKAAAPSAVSPFTGPLAKSSNSQKHSNSSQTLEHQSPEEAQPSPNTLQQSGNLQDSPKRPKDSRTKAKPVKLTERLPSGGSEEDVVPDTQEGLDSKESVSEASLSSSQEEEDSEVMLDASQSSLTSSDELQRSGHLRVPPVLPGEDPQEREAKYTQFKRRRSRDISDTESSTLNSSQSRPNTRSKQAAEERGSRLRTRSQRDSRDLSQTNSQNKTRRKTKLFNFSEDFLGKSPRKRKSTSDLESSQTDNESQSQARRQSRLSKALSEMDIKQVGVKKNRSSDKQESSLKKEPVKQDDKDKFSKDSAVSDFPQTVCNSKESEPTEQEAKDKCEPKKDSQVSSSLPQYQPQKFDKQGNKASLPLDEIHDVNSPTDLMNRKQTENNWKKVERTEENLGQEDSKVSTSTPSESQMRRRSARSKATPSEGEVEEKGNRDSMRRQSRSTSQQTSSDPRGRTTRSGMQQESGPSGRRSMPAGTNMSRSSTGQESSVGSTKRGRKSRASLQSPLILESKEARTSGLVKVGDDASQNKDTLGSKANRIPGLEDSSQTDQFQSPETLSDTVPEGIKVQEKEETLMEVAAEGLLERTSDDRKQDGESASQNQPISARKTSLEESGTKHVDEAESEKKGDEKTNQRLPADSCSADTAALPGGPTENQQLAECHENQKVSRFSTGSLPEVEHEVDPMEPADVCDGQNETESRDIEKDNASAVELKDMGPLQEEMGALQKKVEALEEKVEPLQDEEEEVESLQKKVEAMREEVEALQEKVEALAERVEPLQEMMEPLQEEEVEPLQKKEEEVEVEPLQEEVEVEPLQKEEVEPLQEEEEVEPLQEEEEVEVEPLQEEEEVEVEPLQEEEEVEVEPLQEEEEEEVEPLQEKVDAIHEEVEALQDTVEPLQEKMEPLHEEKVEQQQEEEESLQEEVDAIQEEVEALQEKVEALQEKVEPLQKEPRSSTSEDLVQSSNVSPGNLCGPVLSDSPVKQKDLEAVMAADVGQSPSGGRTRGTWSPSASPSTSILKKSQKRSLEGDSPSPLVKSRRVSFANPIQHQETADDIDRRSPAFRTSSPRRSRALMQPKLVTTPTKSVTTLSPRTLHGHGFRSSKKCLISALTEERRPASRDCVYPALLGCSAPVEAVLPQISSNMWSRGFGQLVRARNIKTVGDLSALSPADIKTLPIRSPKVSTVRKALQTFHQHRRGRGDELKSFDETELMTAEESDDLRPPEEEDKTAAEPLAIELVDESVSEPDGSDGQTVDVYDGQTVDLSDGQTVDRLRWDVEALSCSLTPQRLHRSSPQELVDVHQQLGDMMQRVVLELQTRLQQPNQ